MKYSEITLQIAQLPHVRDVKWQDGCMFIFVDFHRNPVGYDPAPFPILDKAVVKALRVACDEELPYRALGYVDTEGRLFRVARFSDTPMEAVRTSFAQTTSG